MIPRLGRPHHLESHRKGWAVCGAQSPYMVEKGTANVSCFRCRKTKVFKCHAAFEKLERLQRIANAVELGFVNINPVCWRGHLNGIETRVP